MSCLFCQENKNNNTLQAKQAINQNLHLMLRDSFVFIFSTIDNIRQLHGVEVARDLLTASCADERLKSDCAIFFTLF